MADEPARGELAEPPDPDGAPDGPESAPAPVTIHREANLTPAGAAVFRALTGRGGG